MNTSFFGDMLQSIAERGRALIDRTRDRRGVAEQRSANLAHLCEDLLSGRGEASGVALAREILVPLCRAEDRAAHRLFRGAGERFRPRPCPAQRRRHGLDECALGRRGVQAPSLVRAAAARALPPPQSCAGRHRGAGAHARPAARSDGPSRRSCRHRRRLSPPVLVLVQPRLPGAADASTGRRRRTCWRRSSATRRCTRSATGTTCAPASIRRTGAATPSSIPHWSTSR